MSTEINEQGGEEKEENQGLSQMERAILDLEKKRFKYQGSKEQAIGQVLGLTPVAYYQQLNALLDNPRALAAEPALTRRLRLKRDALT